jgi:hypothetical protein
MTNFCNFESNLLVSTKEELSSDRERRTTERMKIDISSQTLTGKPHNPIEKCLFPQFNGSGTAKS